jgi:adenosylmethionine-8-amino-7-oxononanoate aminotransferase
VEAALKLARQYWVDQGLPAKHKLIALTPAYHGNTLLALSVSARPPYSSYYGDWLVKVARMPAPYAYRCDCDGNPRCARCTGALLDEIISREDPDTVAAFIGEPVGGSSTGGAVPRPEYWKTVREICTRHRVLWIADEVLCGAGRTGTWSALEPYGAVPDLAVFGKGISGGYAPLSAVAAPERILDVIARKSGGVLHGQTFANSPVICAAGVAAIRYLKRHRLIERAAAMGPVLQQKLAPLRELAPVGDIRGRGLLAGIELVQDRRTKAPFPRAAKVAERVTEAALEAGLVVWPNTGHANGTDGDQVMLAPPFIIEEPQIDEAVASLRSAIASVA